MLLPSASLFSLILAAIRARPANRPVTGQKHDSARPPPAQGQSSHSTASSARFLIDFDRFVQIVDFPDPPPGHASMAAFNAALVAHVEGHPSLHVPPKDHPT